MSVKMPRSLAGADQKSPSQELRKAKLLSHKAFEGIECDMAQLFENFECKRFTAVKA